MNKILYSFALSLSIITMVMCLISKLSPLTILFRGALVFLGTLFIFFIGANLLRWLIILLTPRAIPKRDRK